MPGEPAGQRMFRGQHHVRGPRQRIRAGGEDLDRRLFPARPGHLGDRQGDQGPVARADPVPLLLLDRLGPLQWVQIRDQPLGERGDPQHPLPQRPAVDGVVADVAAAVRGDLLVGQDRAETGAPVHQLLGAVGEPVAVDHRALLQVGQLAPGRAGRRFPPPGLELADQVTDRPGFPGPLIHPAVEDLQEDPLRPPVERDVRGGDLPPRVVPEPQPAQLPLHGGHVGLGRHLGVLPGVDRVLLGRQLNAS